jgi:hypothetical protein
VNRLPLPVSRNSGQPHNVITPLLHAVLNIYEKKGSIKKLILTLLESDQEVIFWSVFK